MSYKQLAAKAKREKAEEYIQNLYNQILDNKKEKEES
jgi:hypothetical protein